MSRGLRDQSRTLDGGDVRLSRETDTGTSPSDQDPAWIHERRTPRGWEHCFTERFTNPCG